MIQFDEPSHTYRVDGRRVMSVTQAISAAGLIDDRYFDMHKRCTPSMPDGFTPG